MIIPCSKANAQSECVDSSWSKSYSQIITGESKEDGDEIEK